METLKHYLVYKITNKVDGKFYIGKHETYNVDDGYFGSGKLLKRAQDRYGLESFEKQILADFDDPYSMNSMEEILVDAEFVKRKDTYNLTVGGDGGWFHCKGENHNNLHNNRRTGFLHILDIGRNSRLVRDNVIESWDHQMVVDDGKRKVVLNHSPMPFFVNMHDPRYHHLYGHVHLSFDYQITLSVRKTVEELYMHEVRMYNVGCMVPGMRYMPRTLDEIVEIDRAVTRVSDIEFAKRKSGHSADR